MADLFKTNLIIQMAPLPPDFVGKPSEFADAMVERYEVLSPVGTNFFVVGDLEPATNQGPWLKGGSQWYVWSNSLGKYVPQDISASTTQLLVVSATQPAEPADTDPQIWIKITTSGGVSHVVGIYYWSGTEWRPGGNQPPSGPTSSRPTNPDDLEEFWDTDINCMIHWERGAWRTKSGTPGDIKFVSTLTLAAAITSNPGWQYAGENSQDTRGKVFGVAAKDPGATPAAAYSVASGITQRYAGELAGEETHVLTSTEIEQHTHLVGALTLLHSDNNAYFYRVEDATTFSAPNTQPPNYAQVNGEGGATDGTKNGQLPSTAAGTMLVTSRQLSLANAANYTGAAQPHSNLQPICYLWALVKL